MKHIQIKKCGLVAGLVLVGLMVFQPVAIAIPAVPPWRMERPWSTETATVTIGDDVLIAELADTSELRTRGLGYRDELLPGWSMLFVFDGPSGRSFWMKGMRICLDIIWIENGVITGAAENACPEEGVSDVDLARYVSPGPVTYVLEVPAGWMAEHGHAAGDAVAFTFPENYGT